MTRYLRRMPRFYVWPTQLRINCLPPNNPEINQHPDAQSNSDDRTPLRHPICASVSPSRRFWQRVVLKGMDRGTNICVDHHLEK